ncbi:MAG: glutamate--tRNA ligase family protein, partial [Clostridia bacterium]|nr:glutamate--tRNA ligase family protein [Clostridia bacterium]
AYLHLPVVMRDATRKLSKRHGDPSFEDLIDMGYVREAIINFIALLGWSPGDDREFFTLDELVQAFDISGLSKAPSIFNMEKLTWFNGEYIKKMDFEDYLKEASRWFDKALAGKGIDYRRLAELMQGRTDVFSRIPDKVSFLAGMPAYDSSLYERPKLKMTPDIARRMLTDMLSALEGIENWSESAVREAVTPLIQASGMKTGAVLWPPRIAVSGLENTPGGFYEIAGLLGKEETLRRMRDGLSKLI